MIIVSGSLAFDYIMDFPGRFRDRILPDKIHQISLSFLVDDLHKGMGGTAGNIAYTLALLQTEVTIVAAAGKDFRPYRSFLKKHGVETRHIKIADKEYTSTYFGITDLADNQIGAFHIGASKYTKTLTLQGFGKKDFAIIGASPPDAIAHFIDECYQRKIPYLFDPAFQLAVLDEATLRKGIEGAEILIGNDYEIALMEKKVGKSVWDLLGLVPVIITTLGEKGSRILTKDKTIEIASAKAKEIVDPTGAGDAYRAGFVAGHMRGFDIKTCGQMGALAAVYTVEKYGTTTHHFSKRDFIKRYKENYGDTMSI